MNEQRHSLLADNAAADSADSAEGPDWALPCPQGEPPASCADAVQTARLALQAVRQSEQRLQLALWASGEGIWEWEAGTDRFNFDAFEFAGAPLTLPAQSRERFIDQVHADDQEPLRLAWRLHASGARPEFEVSFRFCHGGITRWLRARGRSTRSDAASRPLAITGTVKDITHEREAEESLRLLACAFSQTESPLVITDEHWLILEANAAYARLAGQEVQALVGSSLLVSLPMYAAVLDGLEKRGTWRQECGFITHDGEIVPVEASVSAVLGEELTHTFHIVALRDIRERQAHEARLADLALRDPLTRRPNRLAIEQHLAARLASLQSFALLFIDLQGFQEINDTYGHEAGDALLRAVADRLATHAGLDAGGLLGRWGGDEFVLVLPDGTAETAVRTAAQGVIASLGLPFQVAGDEITLTPLIGAALAPRDATDAAELLRRVDTAMHAAKERGRNGLAFYEPALENNAQRRLRLATQMRQDAERNAFTFVAQPKVDREGCAVGAELLMRWPTAAFGMVSPLEFIPMAERIGTIGLMGRHALHAAARLAARCHAAGQRLPVAVNLSPKQLLQPGLDRQLLLACERAGIAPALLELELTETALQAGLEVVAPVLRRLRAQGFCLALDDFGTGYSSLSYLRHLPFNKVKIDRSFVQDVERDARSVHLLRAMVQMCEALGMSTVAEGVETAAQFAALRELGVHEFQGYHFARPMDVEHWAAQVEAGGAHPVHLPPA